MYIVQAELRNCAEVTLKQDERAVVRANKLCGLLITVLHSSGFFRETFLQEIQESDFPGTYIHWVEMVQDEWKRSVDPSLKALHSPSQS